MINFRNVIYCTLIFACSGCIFWILSPKKEIEKPVYIERDTVIVCPKFEVEKKMYRYQILGYQIVDIDLSDTYYAKITYR